jgi:voltage-gated sodium channel
MMTSIKSLSKQMSRDNFGIKHSRSSRMEGVSYSKVWATKLVNSWIFEMMVALTIVSNAVSIGWSSDVSIKSPGLRRPLVFVVLDWAFLSIFVLELALRMYVERRDFFYYKGKMFGWNVFDTMVVTLTLLNDAHVLPVHLSVVRVFRIVRLVYVVRVIRLMSGFKELRQMIDGIMKCGKTLLWSSLVLTAITYVYAIVCLQFSSEWLSTAEAAKEPSHTVSFLQKNFPSLVYSIYTLFKAVTGGVSWGEVSDPLQDVSPVLIVTFPLFIIVTVLCVLNIVTASFVDAAARKSAEDETAALEHLANRRQWIKVVQDIFARHDSDSTGFLDWDEFAAIMTDWRTRSALQGIGVDISFHHAATLFKCFDWDGDGRIDINEFAQGVHHITGTARSLDMFRQFMKLSRQVSSLAQKLQPDTPPMSSFAKDLAGVDA